LLLAASVLTLGFAAPADAGGKIALYADVDRTACELTDTYPGVVMIHMYYEGDQNARAVAFVAPTPDCWTDAVWLADVIVDPWLSGLGDTHDATNGTIINLLGCRTGDLYLGYMTFQAMGRGEKCCTYHIVGSENDGLAGVIDCDYNLLAVETGDLVINPRGACRCQDGNIIVATEQTTWGHVKALYR
jgi:hypothetical protein